MAELHAFVAEADRQGHPSMATAAMISWEWMLREVDIIGHDRQGLSWSNYRGGNRPNEVLLLHSKNGEGEELMMPLEDNGTLLFPELENRLKNATRRGSLIVMRDVRDRLRQEYLPYKINKFQKLARRILDDAKLNHLKFESFRKGGETECGNADLTDQQIMALDGHKTRDMLTVYAARNKRQRIQGMQKRRVERTKTG